MGPLSGKSMASAGIFSAEIQDEMKNISVDVKR
jgi:hypothetical protein